jgi:integrase
MAWEKTREPGIYRRPRAGRGYAYKVMHRDVIGVQHSRTFGTWDQALEFRASVTLRRPEPRASRSLGELYEQQGGARDYAAETLSTRRSAWKHLEPYASTSIEKITPKVVDEILSKVSGDGMRRKVRSLLSTLFGYAIEQGWATSNPVSRPPKRRTRAEKLRERPEQRKRYLSNDELRSLLEATPERFRAMIELMARMGLRPGEAYALRVGKFDPLKRTLLIDTSVSGFTKTGEPRTLALPSPIASMLVEHIAAFSDPSNPGALMFPTTHGHMIHSDRFRSMTFDKACKAAGLEDVTPNTLRHTAASFAISTGANVYDVQRMLGHAKASMTLDVYGELFEERHERFVEAYGEAIEASRSSTSGSPSARRVVPLQPEPSL